MYVGRVHPHASEAPDQLWEETVTYHELVADQDTRIGPWGHYLAYIGQNVDAVVIGPVVASMCQLGLPLWRIPSLTG